VRFVAIGSGSTLAYFALFLSLQSPLGPFGANAVALVLCSVGNRAAHQHVSETPDTSSSLVQYLLRGAAGFGVSLAFTTGALIVAASISKGSLPLAIAALVPATGAATIVRFWLLRRERARSRVA
jgi:putative flippase GtrA